MYDPYSDHGPHGGHYPPNSGRPDPYQNPGQFYDPYVSPPPGAAGGLPPPAANTTSPLVLGILMTLCCNQICGILAIVFAAIAMGREHEPREQVRFVRYANISLVVGVIVPIVLVVLYVLFIVVAVGASV